MLSVIALLIFLFFSANFPVIFFGDVLFAWFLKNFVVPIGIFKFEKILHD